MTEEEKQTNSQPSGEVVGMDEESIVTPEQDDKSPEVKYSVEKIETGPISEEVKVFKLEDLQEAKEESYEDQAKIYESSLKDIQEEQRVVGKVVSVRDNEILVDVGFKSEGVVFRDEFGEGELPKVGDEIEVFVDILEDEFGQMILSKKKADFMRVWERIKDVYTNDETLEGTIKSRIKGGMVVDVMGIDAFLPGSQIDIRPVTDFDSYVGETYEFRIVKLNELRKNIVLSRKALLEEDLKEKREELLSRIKVGDVLSGKVKNITDFGVFVDLGGLDGLLHITDLSWGRINHPREVVNLDEEIQVKVIDFDPERQRVSLGLKQLTPHPWEGIEQKYPVDSVIEGKVVNITNYGVFVELEKGVEGLIHISEISWTRHIKHPSEVFSLGEMVNAKVLSIDPEERKISLGYKQLEPDPWETIEDKYKIGSVYTGKVTKITSNGVFVQLEEGFDGFVYIADLSWTRKVRHPKEIVHRGDEVKVKILDINKADRKIFLGMKQVEEDPWPMIESTFVEGAIVEGEVIKISDNVIVVKLKQGVEGIVPVSQLPKEDRKDVKKSIDIGQKMQLKVLETNKRDKKVVLSRQQAISKKPKSKTEAYMSSQGETSDKLEIPKKVIDKITESEKKATTATETKETVKKKTKSKKTEEKKSTKATKTEKPAKKSAKSSEKSSTAEKEKASTKKPPRAKKTTKSKTAAKSEKKTSKASIEKKTKTNEKKSKPKNTAGKTKKSQSKTKTSAKEKEDDK